MVLVNLGTVYSVFVKLLRDRCSAWSFILRGKRAEEDFQEISDLKKPAHTSFKHSRTEAKNSEAVSKTHILYL